MSIENGTSTTQPQNLHHKRLLLIASTLFFLLGLIWLIYWIFFGRFHETTDDAYVNGNLVNIVPQITGQVIKILADETDKVTQGEPLVILDKADAYITVKTAESQLALTARNVSQLYENVNQLESTVQVEQNNLQKAKEDYQRRQGLVVNKTISAEDLSHAKIAFSKSIAALALAKQQLASAIDIAGHTDLYHHPQVQQAMTNFRNAYLNWQRTTIYAPVTGYVAKRSVQVGQRVGPGNVLMIIIPLEQVWVDANFKESQLRNIRIDQPAELISDLYGNAVKYQGKVVGLNPGAGNTFDLLPPQNATGNWIKIVQRLPVRIAIDPEQLKKHPLRLGLSMTVTVNTHNRKGLTLSDFPQKRVAFEAIDYSSDLKKADQAIEKILQSNAKNVSISINEDTK